MTLNPAPEQIVCVPSSASAGETCRGKVLISGSYGGEYNAWHAAKWGLRGVILSDAGVGKDRAGISGLDYLDRIGLAAAAVDIFTGRIADSEDMLENGVLSYVNAAARALGVHTGMTVLDAAMLLVNGPICLQSPPAIEGGKRYQLPAQAGGRRVILLDAAPLLQDSDAGAIAVTGSHAALFRGRPDDVVKQDLFAIFFNDAGVGKEQAGIARLADLELRNIAAGTVAADSAPIGDARAAYAHGVLSFVNPSAARKGLQPGTSLKDAIDHLLKLT